MKNPIEINENKRLQALCALAIMRTRPEPVMNRIIAWASGLFQVPINIVAHIEAQEPWFKGCSGLNVNGDVPEQASGNRTILPDEILVVEDAAVAPLPKGSVQ